MDAVAKIRQKLERYPHVTYETDDNGIWILPANEQGFTVGLVTHPKGYTVYFEGWHEEFGRANEEEALNRFAFGLSDSCRLEVSSRANYDYKWTAEYKHGNEWVKWSETGLLWFPFWKKKQIRYLQNSLITGF